MEMLFIGLLSWFAQPTFLYTPGSSAQYWYLLRWTIYPSTINQLPGKKMIYRLAYQSQHYGCIFSIKITSSQICLHLCQVGKKKTWHTSFTIVIYPTLSQVSSRLEFFNCIHRNAKAFKKNVPFHGTSLILQLLSLTII